MGWTMLLGTHSVSPWSRKKTSDWYLSTVTTRPRYHLAVSSSRQKMDQEWHGMEHGPGMEYRPEWLRQLKEIKVAEPTQ